MDISSTLNYINRIAFIIFDENYDLTVKMPNGFLSFLYFLKMNYRNKTKVLF